MIWHCPACRQGLIRRTQEVVCEGCESSYRVIGGVPDFRSTTAVPTSDEREVETAMSIVSGRNAKDPEALINAFFASHEGPGSGGPKETARRVRGTLVRFSKAEREIDGWLGPLLGSGGPILDVGCGLGPVVGAFTSHSVRCAGIDNRLDRLIVTRAILAARFGEEQVAPLAAADAARLPLGDAVLDGIIYYDVVEHVPELQTALREAQRVTRVGGWLAIATPNRLSLGAEPHVGVWGVGWLPRGLQVKYATRRSGIDYSGTVLRSAGELGQLIARATDFEMQFTAPAIDDEEVANFGWRRRALASVYNRLVEVGVVNRALILFGPFYHAMGTRSELRER